jgi:hypothetical protein
MLTFHTGLKPTGSSASQQAIARIKELQAIDHNIRALKTSYNTINVTAQCPPEILSEIFHYCRISPHENCLASLHVTHVCSRWRSVALDCPSLWATVLSTYPEEFFRETLERSKRAQLTVEAGFAKFRFQHPSAFLIPALLLSDFHRVQELSLDGYVQETFVRDCLDDFQIAPVLEVLSLTLGAEESLPDTFLEHAPRLRRVYLYTHSPPWDSPVLSGLTWLSIHIPPNSTNSSMARLLAALGGMLKLEYLKLDSILQETTIVPIPLPTTAITLPRLLEFYFEDNFLTPSRYFFNHVRCPAVRYLGLTLIHENSNSSDIMSSMDAVRWFLSHIPIQIPRQIEIEGLKDCLTLQTDGEAYRITRQRMLISIQSLGNDNQPWDCQLRGEVTQALLGAMSLDQLEFISITGPISLDKSSWRDTFGGLRYLNEISLQTDAWSLFDALISTPKETLSPGEFQALRTLSFTNMAFDDLNLGDGTRLQMLGGFLTARGNIHKLSLEKCQFIRVEDVDELRGCVKKIAWEVWQSMFDAGSPPFENLDGLELVGGSP